MSSSPPKWGNKIGPSPSSSSGPSLAFSNRLPAGIVLPPRLPPIKRDGVTIREEEEETRFPLLQSASAPLQVEEMDEGGEMGGEEGEGQEGAESADEVDGEGKGRRFLRYGHSWARDATDSAGAGRSAQRFIEGKNGLLAYFQGLSNSTEDIDFTTMDHLLTNGADVNATCETSGECVMHQVAANWDTNVADYLLQRGLDVHRPDSEGRTPLHVAASTNHTDVLLWLIEQGAELECTTHTERQTPLHLAARNDSVQAMQILIEKGGNCEMRDYKGRTPLHLAAELDRSNAAECLISVPISAEVRVQDDMGNHAIASMIRTMPHVALQALDQLHKVAPAKRKQYFLLNHLEPEHGEEDTQGVKTPFEIAVEENRHTILAHPVMQTLITEKWRYIRWCFFGHLSLYILFLLSWSILIAYPSVQEQHLYVFPRDSWRIIVQVIALATYVFQMVEEVFEVVYSKLHHRQYRKLRSETLQDDLKNVPSNLAGEKQFLEDELTRLNHNTSGYFKDPWNYLDIATYIIIFVLVILHCVDIGAHSSNLALWVARVSCFVLIFIWVRLFKYARGFRSLGPLIAIVYQLIGDILRYFILYGIFFIPYVISIWVLFGGQQSAHLSDEDRQDLTVFYRVVSMMFRMGLIDDYPYDSLRAIDEAMTVILVTTFLFFLAVVGLNLFIALLSDTFQRVYDNAQAIALLQQAQLILSYDEKLCRCFRQYYLKHIHENCSPRDKFYDDDELVKQPSANETKKITHQIHDIVSQMLERHQMQSSVSENGVTTGELAGVSNVFADYVDEQDNKMASISQQLEDLKALLTTKDGALPAAPSETPSRHRDRHTEPHKVTSPTSPTRQALNELFSHRHGHHHTSVFSGSRYQRYTSVPPSPEPARNVYSTQFSIPSSSVAAGQDDLLRPAGRTLQAGHRRMRRLSMRELKNMQWEKKSQPVERRRAPTITVSAAAAQPTTPHS